MPTYDYECQKCGHTFEQFQSITDRPRSRCPLCRGKVQRLISAGVGVVFKGSGFYINDSRPAKQATATSAEGDSGNSKPTTAGGESAAAKPAAKKTAPKPGSKRDS